MTTILNTCSLKRCLPEELLLIRTIKTLWQCIWWKYDVKIYFVTAWRTGTGQSECRGSCQDTLDTSAAAGGAPPHPHHHCQDPIHQDARDDKDSDDNDDSVGDVNGPTKWLSSGIFYIGRWRPTALIWKSNNMFTVECYQFPFQCYRLTLSEILEFPPSLEMSHLAFWHLYMYPLENLENLLELLKLGQTS